MNYSHYKWRKSMNWLGEVVKTIGSLVLFILFTLFMMWQFGIIHLIVR